jgi:DNA repair exonuclease SbcCD nuclease subunit
VPQCELKKQFEDEVKKIKPDKSSDYNIFTSHGAVTGIKEFCMNEFNELFIPAKVLSKDFDYIGLGHYHKYSKIADNTFYSGSTERFTFTDAPDKKGFIELEYIDDKLKTKFIELKIRLMIDTKPIKCSNLKLEELMNKIRQTVEKVGPKEKTFRITLDDIPSHIYRGIDFGELRKLGGESIHYEIKANVLKKGDSKSTTTSKIDPLVTEFKQFIESKDFNEKVTILELGISYIEKIEAREEGK